MGPEKDQIPISAIGKVLDKTSEIEIAEYNKYANIGLSDEETDFYENFPKEKHQKLLRKIDIRLVPVLALLYLCAHIDRANIGNAKIEGMLDDLNMSGIQYNIAYVHISTPTEKSD